jgi:hypothetical protein
MICRSKERGEAAQKEIIEKSKNDVFIKLCFFLAMSLIKKKNDILFIYRKFTCLFVICHNRDKCLSLLKNLSIRTDL